MQKQKFAVILLCFSLVLSACMPIQPVANTDTADPAAASSDAGDQLPIDADVRTGKLDNGLTYFIRRNSEPAKRAELRLAVNAGSVYEDDDQKGLAHLLEHMLFNGTERFPKQELIDYMQSVGMRFGADINAYTSFDETVYMLQVPTDDQAILEKGFDILEDWAGYALLEDEEIEAERGVVVEEWRLRDQGAQGRIINQWYPQLLEGSKYADRLPIGDVEIIRNASPDTVRRFYETWYRPDLMSVIAVGDFDVDQVEEWIISRFSKLTNPAASLALPEIPVKIERDARTMIITDPEYPYAEVMLSTQQLTEPLLTSDNYRSLLVASLFNEMLNARFDEISRQSEAPFLYAVSYQNDIVRPVQTTNLYAQVADDKITTGVEALATELERLVQHGFTASELDRAKQQVLRRYEQLYAERETSDSANFADEYVDHFLTGNAIPGIAAEYELTQGLLPAISLDEVNQHVTNLTEGKSRDLLVIAPEKEGVVLPAETDLTVILSSVQASAIEPYVDQVTNEALMSEIPAPVEILDKIERTDLGVTQIEFANGVKVVMKPTDFKEDEVLMSASSPGGSSLVTDEDYIEANFATQVVANSGVGAVDYNTLTRMLTGKIVSVNPYIGELAEGFQGNSSPKDLETLFQLVHLYVTAPRNAPAALESLQNQLRAYIKNRELSPDEAFGDAIRSAFYGDSIRFQPPSLADVDNFDGERAFALYQERFADVGDFTFVFVGNFELKTVTDLARTYLGTLPGGTRDETWVDVRRDPPSETIETDVFKGEDEQSQTLLAFIGTIESSQVNRLHLQILTDILDIRLTKDLREERSAAYAVSAAGEIEKDPDQTYLFYVWFGSDPKRSDELVEATFGQIEDLQTNGPSDEEVATAKEQERREHEEKWEQNEFWLSQLEYYATNPDEEPSELLEYQTLLDGVEAADIQQVAEELLTPEPHIKVVLLPASYEGK